MTPEEAYKILNGEIIYKGGRNNGKRFAMGELNRVINEALEKQIPKKPDWYGEESLFCPVCMTSFGYASDYSEEMHRFNYCANCGQAIDWGE